MKKLILLLATTMFFVSCSKDNDDESFVSASEEDIEVFESISEDVSIFLAQNVNATYEEIQSYLTKYSSNVSFAVEDSFLYISTPGGLEIQVDKYGLSKMEESTESIGINDFNDMATTVDKSLGIIDETGTRSVTENEKTREANSITRGARNDERVLNSRRILLWAPWDELDIYDFQRTVHAIAQAYHLDFNQDRDEYIGNDCSLESMKTFGDYDIVVLVCHGNSRGQLVVPYNKKWKERIGKGARVGDFYLNNGTQYEKAVILDKDMTACLPKNMSKTILWTAMCYAFADKSAIKNAVLKADAADFIGATNKIGKNEVLPRLNGFAVRFYRGATTAEAFYPGTPRKTYYKYEIKSGIKGLYCKGDIDNVYYQYPLCLPAKGTLIRGCQTGSRIKTRTDNSPTRATTNTDAGFWIKNTETEKETTIPFSESSKVSYTTYSFENITSYIYECKTDNLEEGNYEYRTYERVNGETVYSDETYKFKKTENYAFILRYSRDYKHTLYAPDEVWVQSDQKDTKDSIIIAKYNGLYYCKGISEGKVGVYINEYEPLENSTVPYTSDGKGSVSITIIEDNIKIKYYCDNYMEGKNIKYNSRLEGEINLADLDYSPKLTIMRSSYYSHSNKYGLFKHVDEYKYTYTGYERMSKIPWGWFGIYDY